jgi:hypothetical protein
VDSDGKTTKGFIISVSSTFRVYWDILIIVCSVYLALAIPLRINRQQAEGKFDGYRFAHSPSRAWLWGNSIYLDYAVDLVFIADIILTARFFAYAAIEGGKAKDITDKVSLRSLLMHRQCS